MIKMREDMLYIFKMEEFDYKEHGHKIGSLLSEECIYFDKGRAAYHHGFDNPYLLIGLYRTLFNEPCRSELMATVHKLGDVFVIGNQNYVAIWTGTWEPLERMGFVAVVFNSQFLAGMINEITSSYDKHGELRDRV